MSRPYSESTAKPSQDSALIYVSAMSLAVIVFVFAVSNSSLGSEAKYGALALGVIAYIGFAFVVSRWLKKERRAEAPASEPTDAFTPEIESKLAALSDASEFFGASLRPDDLFRLVTSRLAEIVPFTTCVLSIRDKSTGLLKIKCIAGENAQHFSSGAGLVERSLAHRVLESGEVENDPLLELERSVQGAEALKGLASAVAAPIGVDGESFGAIVLYSAQPADFQGTLKTHFSAAVERISPLLASSFAFERSVDNALTDPVTGLPNERGFFLVLESQIAESHRFRDARPLTVLTMDVAEFSDFNSTHGHAVGNRLLGHVASVLKGQLRQMDILTRSAADEFLAILPTANEAIADEIVARVRRAFASNPFAVDGQSELKVGLNFGSATFWRDGETAQALLQTARLRKQETKAGDGKVLFFPRELG